MAVNRSLILTLAPLAMLSATPAFATDKDIDAIRQELADLKKLYQQKIEALEQRIQDTEEQNDETTEQTQQLAIDLSQQSNRTAANTFNPGIGVVLNGKYLQAPSDYEFSMPGYFLGEEPGPGEGGLSLGESELNLSANIDDKFYGSLTVAFGEETEVEEAFIQTIGLANGFSVKAGKFFSGIGYLNSHHGHTDDFAVRPLAYQAFLGPNFGDAGVQVSWLAPTALYWETGAELFRGDAYPAAGAANKGKGITTVYSHIGGDLGLSQSWRAGVSYLQADVDQRFADEDAGDSFSGDSKLWLADFVWKWAPDGNNKVTNAKIQAEYFSRTEQGQLATSADLLDVDHQQTGWYVQGIYQFMPQWRVGLRYEGLQSDGLPTTFHDTVLDTLDHDPRQVSMMVDWSNSEFSRVRLQFSRDQASPQDSDLVILQYITAFGAHGAHAF